MPTIAQTRDIDRLVAKLGGDEEDNAVQHLDSIWDRMAIVPRVNVIVDAISAMRHEVPHRVSTARWIKSALLRLEVSQYAELDRLGLWCMLDVFARQQSGEDESDGLHVRIADLNEAADRLKKAVASPAH